LEAIAGVDGVDGVFIGPADLAASLGHPGEPNHPAAQSAIEDAIRRIRACGKPAGILSPDTAFVQRCIEVGTTFTAVAIDIGILARGAEKIAKQFRVG
jgi:4-hydroxy-2-oxoheptanedioate aldolase